MHLKLLRTVTIASLLVISSASSAQVRPTTRVATSDAQAMADVKIVKERLIESLLITDAMALASLAEEAARYEKSLRADGTWPDLTYRDTGPGPWGPSKHMDRVLAMAKAFRSAGQPLAGDAKLRDRTLLALEHALVNDYRQANWWFQEIGIPTQVGNAMLLMDGETSADQMQRALKILERSGLKNYTGANLAWIARVLMMRGCLEPSAATVAQAFSAMWKEVEVVPPGREGIQADFSFHQHGPLIYAGGYGASFMVDATQFTRVAVGTRFALPAERLRVLESFMLDGQQWFVRTNWDYGVGGREITRDYPASGTNSLRTMAALLAKVPGTRTDELEEAASRNLPGGKPLVGNRHFWRSDMMTHHRAGYYASMRMFSTRTVNTDGHKGGTINNEGKLSHHIADGAMYFVQKGDEYRGIFPVWDWNRIPGTTAEQATIDPKLVYLKGESDVVGGVSDDTYGAAAMDLVRGELKARKATFYFDDEFVCLGAGISSTSDKPILTSVNQTSLRGEVRVAEQSSPLPVGSRASSARWVLHDGVGYVFPKPTQLHIANQPQHGRWSDIGSGVKDPVSMDVFSAWIDHGTGPRDASYEYVIVPGTNAEQLAARADKSPVETLSNTPSLQAARHKKLGIVEAVFWLPGTVNGGDGWRIGVDQPCILLMRETTNGVSIAVSNPKNAALTVNVSIDRTLKGDGTQAKGGSTVIRFELPGGPRGGQSVVKSLTR